MTNKMHIDAVEVISSSGETEEKFDGDEGEYHNVSVVVDSSLGDIIDTDKIISSYGKTEEQIDADEAKHQ